MNNQELLHNYFQNWVETYKVGAIRDVTMMKYRMSHHRLQQLAPKLKLCDVTRLSYQGLLNDYAQYHERTTTMDFHHHVKAAILDAVNEGLIDRTCNHQRKNATSKEK